VRPDEPPQLGSLELLIAAEMIPTIHRRRHRRRAALATMGTWLSARRGRQAI